MLKLPYKIIIPMAAVAIVGTGIYGVSQASAASSDQTQKSSLIQKLADTFHVDPSKVQAVFDQNRQQNETDGEAKYEARLAQAVTDGKLTAAQKDLVLAEHKKLAAETDAARTGADSSSTTHATNRAALKQIRAEGNAWAQANNIDAKWLMGGLGGMMRSHGGGTMHPMGSAGANSPSPSPAASSN